jgi:hypothetical protein
MTTFEVLFLKDLLTSAFLTSSTVKPAATSVITVEIREIPRIIGHFPSSKLKEVIILTEAGRKKKARFSSKKSVILFIISSLIIPIDRQERRSSIPTTLLGIGNLVIFCISSPMK